MYYTTRLSLKLRILRLIEDVHRWFSKRKHILRQLTGWCAIFSGNIPASCDRAYRSARRLRNGQGYKPAYIMFINRVLGRVDFKAVPPTGRRSVEMQALPTRAGNRRDTLMKWPIGSSTRHCDSITRSSRQWHHMVKCVHWKVTFKRLNLSLLIF